MSSEATTVNLQLETGNKQIVKIALPIAAALFVPQLNFITNNIFLGRLGQAELAIAGITGVYYLIFAVIGNGLNNALQALISRRAGENRTDEINGLFRHGVRLSLFFSVGGILITWFLAPIILRWSLHDSKGIDMAIQFLRIRILGLPFLYVYQMRNALLVGTNNSKYLVIGTATETIVNIVLDYAFIYGKLGFPALGFNGAAYASILAEISGLIIVFLVIRYNGVAERLQLLRKAGKSKDTTKLILVQAYPIILQYAISIISWEYFYILIEHHGSLALAISNTMRNLFGFFGCFTWGFAATTNTMVSNVIGQNKQTEVIPLINRIMKLSLLVAFISLILINVFPELFLSVYGQGPEFIEAAIPVLRIVSFAMLLMSFGTIWVSAVTGTGNSKMNLYTEIFTIFIYLIYVYITLEHLNLSIGIGWLSEWLYWITMFVPSYWYIHSLRWKKLKI
ncbi:MAG: MATE family efflux transporter [Sediminibacterium sp.]|nr:MATE family efflux transporter [Sediminibacterium sp.]